ncbi:hypothetical protein Tco_1005843 [Tanacetum coccineum]|uniref:Uncharacterized protein n=1 Tax=Tanacetum coccineum TaxID=301880 RepID=A0ABQ5FH88_9ASTR
MSFSEGDCSSSNELGDHGVAGDDYEGAPVFDDGYEEAPIFDDDQFEEESMPVYDTDIEDVIEEEEVFIEKGRFGGKEDNIEDVVVMANDLYSSMIQTTCVNFSKIINSNPHELIWFQKVNLVEVSILIGKKYHEGYLKDAPMDDKLGFKTIKAQVAKFSTTPAASDRKLRSGVVFVYLWEVLVNVNRELNTRKAHYSIILLPQFCLLLAFRIAVICDILRLLDFYCNAVTDLEANLEQFKIEQAAINSEAAKQRALLQATIEKNKVEADRQFAEIMNALKALQPPTTLPEDTTTMIDTEKSGEDSGNLEEFMVASDVEEAAITTPIMVVAEELGRKLIYDFGEADLMLGSEGESIESVSCDPPAGNKSVQKENIKSGITCEENCYQPYRRVVVQSHNMFGWHAMRLKRRRGIYLGHLETIFWFKQGSKRRVWDPGISILLHQHPTAAVLLSSRLSALAPD